MKPLATSAVIALPAPRSRPTRLGVLAARGKIEGLAGRHFPSLHHSHSASAQKPLVKPLRSTACRACVPSVSRCTRPWQPHGCQGTGIFSHIVGGRRAMRYKLAFFPHYLPVDLYQRSIGSIATWVLGFTASIKPRLNFHPNPPSPAILSATLPSGLDAGCLAGMLPTPCGTGAPTMNGTSGL